MPLTNPHTMNDLQVHSLKAYPNPEKKCISNKKSPLTGTADLMSQAAAALFIRLICKMSYDIQLDKITMRSCLTVTWYGVPNKVCGKDKTSMRTKKS